MPKNVEKGKKPSFSVSHMMVDTCMLKIAFCTVWKDKVTDYEHHFLFSWTIYLFVQVFMQL